MVSRVATGFQNQNSLRQLRENHVNIERSSFQVTTGFKGKDLLSYSTEANELLNLYDIEKNTDMYLNNIQTADTRLKATESALQGMTDILTEAASLWTLGRNENSAETRAALAPKAESLADTYFNIFKTKFDDRYIFSGQNGEKVPTNAVATSTTWPGSPVPTTYYQGDSSKAVIISGPGQTTEYGVVGDESALAKMKAGLEALWYGLENNSETDMDSAIAALQDVQTELSSLLGEVGGQLSSLGQLEDRHTNSKSFMTEQIDKLDKVDITEAITEFTQQQASLEASMLVITQVNRLSLLDFLR